MCEIKDSKESKSNNYLDNKVISDFEERLTKLEEYIYSRTSYLDRLPKETKALIDHKYNELTILI